MIQTIAHSNTFALNLKIHHESNNTTATNTCSSQPNIINKNWSGHATNCTGTHLAFRQYFLKLSKTFYLPRSQVFPIPAHSPRSILAFPWVPLAQLISALRSDLWKPPASKDSTSHRALVVGVLSPFLRFECYGAHEMDLHELSSSRSGINFPTVSKFPSSRVVP